MWNCKALGIELALVALFGVMTVGFIITYVVSVAYGHVYPYFPYISDTGAEPPESCVFSLICSIGSILVLLITVIRYKHIAEFFYNTRVNLKCLNITSTMLGVLCVFGLLLVGSFQDTNVIVIHFLGAFMVFGLGSLFAWLQLIVGYKIYRSNLSSNKFLKCVLIFRLVLCLICTFAFIGTVLFAPISMAHHKKLEGDCTHCWTTKNGLTGYALHIISTVCEWIMSLSFLLYFLTFHQDFVQISVNVYVQPRYYQTELGNGATVTEETPPAGATVTEKTPLT